GFKRNQGIGITEDLMDARSLFLTPNTTTVYVFLCLDPKDGPMVMQVPPGVLGPVDDADFRWVTDVGLTGPDAGKGGKYLFVPPGYTGTLPSDGYFVAKPRTNTLLVFYRAFVKAGDIAATVRNVKANAAIYPLHATTETGEPPATTFVNTSGVRFNTISANTFWFYEELNGVVKNEPANFVDPDTVGLFAAIGIKKGKPFAPDARMKAILTDAVAVANGFARGQEPNWVQTMPGKGWNVLLRLYGPLEPWFDKSWKPGDIELVQYRKSEWVSPRVGFGSDLGHWGLWVQCPVCQRGDTAGRFMSTSLKSSAKPKLTTCPSPGFFTATTTKSQSSSSP